MTQLAGLPVARGVVCPNCGTCGRRERVPVGDRLQGCGAFRANIRKCRFLCTARRRSRRCRCDRRRLRWPPAARPVRPTHQAQELDVTRRRRGPASARMVSCGRGRSSRGGDQAPARRRGRGRQAHRRAGRAGARAEVAGQPHLRHRRRPPGAITARIAPADRRSRGVPDRQGPRPQRQRRRHVQDGGRGAGRVGLRR